MKPPTFVVTAVMIVLFLGCRVSGAPRARDPEWDGGDAARWHRRGQGVEEEAAERGGGDADELDRAREALRMVGYGLDGGGEPGRREGRLRSVYVGDDMEDTRLGDGHRRVRRSDSRKYWSRSREPSLDRRDIRRHERHFIEPESEPDLEEGRWRQAVEYGAKPSGRRRAYDSRTSRLHGRAASGGPDDDIVPRGYLNPPHEGREREDGVLYGDTVPDDSNYPSRDSSSKRRHGSRRTLLQVTDSASGGGKGSKKGKKSKKSKMASASTGASSSETPGSSETRARVRKSQKLLKKALGAAKKLEKARGSLNTDLTKKRAAWMEGLLRFPDVKNLYDTEQALMKEMQSMHEKRQFLMSGIREMEDKMRASTIHDLIQVYNKDSPVIVQGILQKIHLVLQASQPLIKTFDETHDRIVKDLTKQVGRVTTVPVHESPFLSGLAFYFVMLVPLVTLVRVGIRAFDRSLEYSFSEVLLLTDLFLAIVFMLLAVLSAILREEPLTYFRITHASKLLFAMLVLAILYLWHMLLLTVEVLALGTGRVRLFASVAVGIHFVLFMWAPLMTDQMPNLYTFSYFIYMTLFGLITLDRLMQDSYDKFSNITGSIQYMNGMATALWEVASMAVSSTGDLPQRKYHKSESPRERSTSRSVKVRTRRKGVRRYY